MVGFETTFESDWYLSLRRNAFELTTLDDGHATVPAGYGALPRGVILNIEVDDVVHRRLSRRPDIDVVLPLRDEDFGQRHVIIVAPDGIFLDVIQPIPPTGEYGEAYVQT